MINNHNNLGPDYYSALLAFESWIVDWTSLMLRELVKDLYPEEQE